MSRSASFRLLSTLWFPPGARPSLTAGSAIAMLSKKYLGDLASRNTISVALVGLSETGSGIGAVLHQVIADRSHQPSARSANATIHGMPIRSLGLRSGTFSVLR